MKRRTSALSVSAAALLLAAPLLTGCSGDSHPGAAAVVGEERISLAQLQAHVEQVRDAQRAEQNAEQIIATSASLSRDTVSYLVSEKILERAAQDAGLEASRRDVQQERALMENYLGGSEAVEQYFLAQETGLPLAAEQIEGMLRSGLHYQRLSEEFGEREVQTVLTETAEEMGVEINPRYGEWDNERMVLGEAAMPWLQPEAPEAPELPATLEG